MANLSDAFGTIHVYKVGQEFLAFLNHVQGPTSDAYYTLVDPDDLTRAEVDKKGDLEFTFSTFGRWSYGTNLDGYLKGTWMDNEHDKPAYDKFIKQLIKKGGLVDIEYTDSDGAMDWMGTGGFRMEVEDSEVQFSEGFESEGITIARYAEMNGEDESWALEYLKGDDVLEAYDKYVKMCKAGKKEPVSADAWYDTIYEEE